MLCHLQGSKSARSHWMKSQLRQQNVSARSYPRRPKRIPSKRLSRVRRKPPSTDTLATDKSNNSGIQTRSEDGILSPRAIPANLANPFNSWRDVSGTEWHDSEISPLRKVPPKISTVEKLGFLVERGWVGMDVFGKAYNDRHISDNITTKSHLHHARVKYRSRSSGDEARPIMLPLHNQSRHTLHPRRPVSLMTRLRQRLLIGRKGNLFPWRFSESARENTPTSWTPQSHEKKGARRRSPDAEQLLLYF